MILLSDQSQWRVWDLDTAIGFPVLAEAYLVKTFQRYEELANEDPPLFRVINAKEFIDVFSSDRSHMLDDLGQWLSPPPPWPPILQGSIATFEKFVDMHSGWIGEVLTLDDMYAEFTSKAVEG